MSLKYISTRGKAPISSFEDVMLAGLASDGGLYVPDTCPKINAEAFKSLQGKSYVDIAHRVIFPFVGDCIDDGTLHGLLTDCYAGFHHKDTAPLVQLDNNMWVMELFHGPTLAFKDFALQFLGRMFDYVLNKQDRRLTIIGATSGDTGSAAIEACRDRDCLDVFILHPKGRVSEVQRRQMTTVESKNIYNIAIEGSFDDCQDMVKAMFNDHDFRDSVKMSAINSINWARIVGQVVYYVSAYVRLMDKVDNISFSVPTGNFGNVYSAYVAQSMGVPIEKIIVGTNSNDILYRFLQTGEMKKSSVVLTISPSMDIQVSSNFERLLFDLYGRNSDAVCQTMEHFRKAPFKLDENIMDRVNSLFDSACLDDAQTSAVIKEVYDKTGYLSDPHTAVGLGAAMQHRAKNPDAHVVTLATAHPAKFPDAVMAASGVQSELPSFLSDLHQRKERYDVMPNDLEAVKSFIKGKLQNKSTA